MMTDTEAINEQSVLKQSQSNLFELQGYHTHISYSSSSITGVPQLSYSARSQNRNFSGEEFLLQKSKLDQSVAPLSSK